jgi:hypothetical protein
MLAGGEEGTPALISFRTYQNEDKTWGFTIFINNAPLRNFKTLKRQPPA